MYLKLVNIVLLFLENKMEFIEKYLKAKVFVKLNTISQPILSNPGINRIAVGNWFLISRNNNKLNIQNSDSLEVYLFIYDKFTCFPFLTLE